MKDVAFEIRKSYFTALKEISAPVFDMIAPANTPSPYVIISDISEQDASLKTDFTNNIQVTIEVVTEFLTAQNKGRKQGELIMEEITKILFPDIPTSEGYQLLATKKESSRSLMDVTDVSIIYRKISTFSHIIKEI